jgi:hypothetical protein
MGYEAFESLYRMLMLFRATVRCDDHDDGGAPAPPPQRTPPPQPQPPPPQQFAAGEAIDVDSRALLAERLAPLQEVPLPPLQGALSAASSAEASAALASTASTVVAAGARAFRVAMVATKAPSEPVEMLQRTLSAMLEQDWRGAYDVWLADEDPTSEMRGWCEAHGVRISCRKGAEGYHNAEWPRRRRCKEGNLAWFYDNYGYALYDVVCQFDADHVPTEGYLSSVVPAFLQPRVGYVACPSICDANRDVSWAVRGRLYLEAYMHGPLGASKALTAMPCCIGSHYVVRTAALKEIGGIGPE